MTALIDPVGRPVSGRLQLVPDTGGTIRFVALQVVPEASSRPQIEIIRGLAAAHALLVCGSAPLAASVRRALTRARVPRSRYTVIQSEHPDLTLWARDTFASTSDEAGRPTLLLPARSDLDTSEADRRVPYLIGPHIPPYAQVVQSNYYFEGGNVVSDETWTFIGHDVIADNEPEDGSRADRHRVRRRLRDVFGREIRVIGSAGSPPPLDHIDMFLTPLGGGRVLVGDPLAAVTTLLAIPWERWAHYESRFNRPSAKAYGGPPFSLFEVVERNAAPELAGWFNGLAARLAADGLEVFRMPLLICDDEQQLPIISYNNVVQELGPGGPRVLLPRYRIDELDEEAQRRWEALGREVHAVDLSKTLDLHGAVRCLTQVITRDPVS